MQEFSTGFERLYGLGPAVTVFGSARFGEEAKTIVSPWKSAAS